MKITAVFNSMPPERLLPQLKFPSDDLVLLVIERVSFSTSVGVDDPPKVCRLTHEDLFFPPTASPPLYDFALAFPWRLERISILRKFVPEVTVPKNFKSNPVMSGHSLFY